VGKQLKLDAFINMHNLPFEPDRFNMYDIWFSGGRDSTVMALYIYKELGLRPARLVWINTGICLPTTREYVHKFAEWLGIELVVLKPKVDFWECVKRWGYPCLLYYRWCYTVLKREPAAEFLKKEMYEERLRPLWCVGIRLEESKRRDMMFSEISKKGGISYYSFLSRISVWYWFPLLKWKKREVISYLNAHNAPKNPSWDLGLSGECLCMSAMSRKTLDKLIMLFPDVARWMAEKDREVQDNKRRKELDVYPFCLKYMMPLHKYIQEKLKQRTIVDF